MYVLSQEKNYKQLNLNFSLYEMLLVLSDIKAQTEKKNAKHDFFTLMLLKQTQVHVMEAYDNSRNNQFPNLC